MTRAVERKITQARLKDLLHYDPETGNFTWRQVRGGKLPGDIAGSVCRARGKDYRRIRVDDELVMAHRLAWLYMHGVWPDDELDHEDGDGLNNRIRNLVPAGRQENNVNASRRSDNKSGHPGVHFHKRIRKWAAALGAGGKIWLGYYDKLEDAIAARKAAEAEHGYHPQHGKLKP